LFELKLLAFFSRDVYVHADHIGPLYLRMYHLAWQS
jgi:hypothetical protein